MIAAWFPRPDVPPKIQALGEARTGEASGSLKELKRRTGAGTPRKRRELRPDQKEPELEPLLRAALNLLAPTRT